MRVINLFFGFPDGESLGKLSLNAIHCCNTLLRRPEVYLATHTKNGLQVVITIETERNSDTLLRLILISIEILFLMLGLQSIYA